MGGWGNAPVAKSGALPQAPCWFVRPVKERLERCRILCETWYWWKESLGRRSATTSGHELATTQRRRFTRFPCSFYLFSRPTAMAATTEPAAGVRQLSCQVNGEQVQLDLPKEDGLTLLDVLRDFLGITSPKNGCSPQAQCGCCTVLMDGKPILSCAIAPSKAEGKSITTLEGLDEEHRRQISESFVRCGGVQCGFCIPGMAMRGVGLCDKTPSPSRGEIATALKPHLCRCTGYTQIVDSIDMYGRMRRGEAIPEPTAEDKSGRIGTDLPRYTGHD